MPVDPGPTEVSPEATRFAESMADLWRRAHEDVAPSVSARQMRVLLLLEQERTGPDGVADCLGIDSGSVVALFGSLEQRTLVRRVPPGDFRLTDAGKRLLEATRQRRRQLLEQVLAVTRPPDRPVLREAINQHGQSSRIAWVPRSRTPR
jgi:DNA-binding MarR family transcriptional regulator